MRLGDIYMTDDMVSSLIEFLNERTNRRQSRSTMLSQQDVVERLRVVIESYGSQTIFADESNISIQYVNDVLRGRKEPGKKILHALGLERIVNYREKEQKQ